MKIQIKNRWDMSLIFECEADSMKLAVELAIKNKADLRLADLRSANLRSAYLSSANLRLADLSWANLSLADLSSANLRSADLRSANLRSADLRLAQQVFIRDDIWAVLSCAPSEVEGLRQALIEGKIDGSHYEGQCACLVGTIAKVKGCGYKEISALAPDSGRASERFFMGINKGDTPETNPISKQALIWIDEWLFNMKNAFGDKK